MVNFFYLISSIAFELFLVEKLQEEEIKKVGEKQGDEKPREEVEEPVRSYQRGYQVPWKQFEPSKSCYRHPFHFYQVYREW